MWSGSCVNPSPATSPRSLWLLQAKVQPGYVVSVGDSVIPGLWAPGGWLITVSFDRRNHGQKSLDPEAGAHSLGGARREHWPLSRTKGRVGVWGPYRPQAPARPVWWLTGHYRSWSAFGTNNRSQDLLTQARVNKRGYPDTRGQVKEWTKLGRYIQWNIIQA